MASLHSAVLALIEQMQRNPVGRAQQTFKAFVGLAVIIVLPTAMVWWARKRFRP
ncbi:MAG TPA: hypothetical protein VFP26_07030 [Gemmatimonadaceae bacterium]|nr:hypothetical protein [Gemmatimonadaceae bacterium]